MQKSSRLSVTLLAVSALAFGGWQASEGFRDSAYIPVAGDVPTIGYGSTRYEDGTPVAMGDTITRERAEALAHNLMSADERQFVESLPGVFLHQDEFDLYMDFVGQYGIGAWRGSSIRAYLIKSQYVPACNGLLNYRFMTDSRPRPGWQAYQFKDGRPVRWRFDCSTPGNRTCLGVWTRQQERHTKCLAAAVIP